MSDSNKRHLFGIFDVTTGPVPTVTCLTSRPFSLTILHLLLILVCNIATHRCLIGFLSFLDLSCCRITVA